MLAWASARLPLELMEEEPGTGRLRRRCQSAGSPAPGTLTRRAAWSSAPGSACPCGLESDPVRRELRMADRPDRQRPALEGECPRGPPHPLEKRPAGRGRGGAAAAGDRGHLRLRLRGRGWPALYSDLRPRLCPLGEAVWGDPAGDGGTCAPDRPERVLRFALSGGAGTLSIQRRDGEASACPVAEGLPAVLVSAPGNGAGWSTAGTPSRRNGRRQRGEQVVLDWRKKVSALRFSTPEPALDRYLNGWALYQVLACRLMARTSQYQNGGAYGFRDQLQDVRACCSLCRSGPGNSWCWPPPANFRRETCSTGGIRPMGRGSGPDHRRPAVAALCAGGISGGDGDWSVCGRETCYLESPAPCGGGEQERYETPRCSEREHGLPPCPGGHPCAMERGAGSQGLASDREAETGTTA